MTQTWVSLWSLSLYVISLDHEDEPQISFECQWPENCEFLCTGVKDLSKHNTGNSVNYKTKIVPREHFVTLQNFII